MRLLGSESASSSPLKYISCSFDIIMRRRSCMGDHRRKQKVDAPGQARPDSSSRVKQAEKKKKRWKTAGGNK
jgi:hypothetical protein